MSTGLENECKLSYNNGFRCPLGTGVAGREKKLVIDSKESEIALQTPLFNDRKGSQANC